MKNLAAAHLELTAEDRRQWKEMLEEYVEFLGRRGYLSARARRARADRPPGNRKRSDDTI